MSGSIYISLTLTQSETGQQLTMLNRGFWLKLWQAQLVKDGVLLLSEAGFNVEANVCGGSFTNKATENILGRDFKSSEIKTEIPHLNNPAKLISLLFDACYLLKNIRPCLIDLGSICSQWNSQVELHSRITQVAVYLQPPCIQEIERLSPRYAKNKMKVTFAHEL
ncbi:hypothetical protein PoB_007360500 [Plakobranchus ocellatus]|uniref:Uncharacterized protein n=1 Tax=Plakobranchus ocellatus TaxID=259542 RepID=A0AAV4DSU6_9GAST|nr:hypothetical protein PoB_007360500 [Plakobranchus ocellatus]